MFPGETTAEDMDGRGRVWIVQGNAWEVGRIWIVILGPTDRIVFSKRAIPSKMNGDSKEANQRAPGGVRGRDQLVRGFVSLLGPEDVAIADKYS